MNDQHGTVMCRAMACLQVYTMLTGELCDESKSYFVAFRSEFVVSRERLQAQPLATYQKLHSYVGVRPARCFCHCLVSSGSACVLIDPATRATPQVQNDAAVLRPLALTRAVA